MARPSSKVIAQIGTEVTPGTVVAATKKLTTLNMKHTPNVETKFTRASGSRFPTSGVANKVWSEGTFDGILSYEEAAVVLDSVFHTTTPTSVGTGGFQRIWNSESTAVPKTYTLEYGDSTSAAIAAYIRLVSLSLKFGRDGADISGNLLGQASDETSALTSISAAFAEKPVSGNEVCLYLDSTAAGLGTTLLTDAFAVDVSFGDVAKPKWVINCNLPSFKELVDDMLENASVSIELENNAQGRTLYEAAFANALPPQFLRIDCTGALISAGFNYLNRFDFALKAEKPERSEFDGVTYGYKFNFKIIKDATWAKAFEFKNINMLATI